MIREFAHGDCDCVLALLVATGNFNAAEIAVAKELMDIISTSPGQTDYYGFVHAGTSGELAGFLIIGPVPITTGTWDMYWMAVHPRCYGTGVAQELDSFAEAFVRERGGYWIILETSGQAGYARTRRFFAKQRYRELARIPDFYKPGDDMIMFGKRLTG